MTVWLNLTEGGSDGREEGLWMDSWRSVHVDMSNSNASSNRHFISASHLICNWSRQTSCFAVKTVVIHSRFKSTSLLLSKLITLSTVERKAHAQCTKQIHCLIRRDLRNSKTLRLSVELAGVTEQPTGY